MRASDIERIAQLSADVVVVAHRIEPAAAPAGSVVRGGYARLVLEAIRHRARAVEVPEPLWLKEWWKGLIAAVAIRVALREQVLLFTYAIENLPVRDGMDLSRIGMPARAAMLVNPLWRTVWGLSIRLLDVVVFGTEAARQNYAGEWRWLAESRVLTESLGRCVRCFPTSAAAPCRREVLFVSEVGPRKGIDVLMRAWERADLEQEDWTLRVLGDGPLAETVDAWASTGRRSYDRHPTRDEVHAALRAAAIVVLPSVRVPGWREQVGLPLLEGLGHGAIVVTTTESGLSDVLRSQGHLVVPPGDSAALAEALERARGRFTGFKRLPEQAGGSTPKVWELVEHSCARSG